MKIDTLLKVITLNNGRTYDYTLFKRFKTNCPLCHSQHSNYVCTISYGINLIHIIKTELYYEFDDPICEQCLVAFINNPKETVFKSKLGLL